MNDLSRRELIRVCSLGTLAWNSCADTAAAQEEIRRTPAQILGPYYPVSKPVDHDADLTRIKGRGARAAGQVIELAGRVTTINPAHIPKTPVSFAHRTSTSTCSAGRIGS